MTMNKEQYQQFLKAYKKAYYVEISFRTTAEISSRSWSAPATTTVKLSWTADGVKCSYTAQFDGRVTYALGEQEEIDRVGHVGYSFTSTTGALKYLFDGIAKDGNIFFCCEVSNTLSKSAVRIEVTANVDQGKKFYGNVPVDTSVVAYAWSLNVTPRQQKVDA